MFDEMRDVVYITEEMPSRIRLPKFTCVRCGKEWHPRKPERPRRCPQCGDANWEKPRQWERTPKPEASEESIQE